MVINNKFSVVLQASQATEIGNQLFNRLLDEGVLIMPKIANEEGLEDMSRWHMNGSHTTEQCQVFREFLATQLTFKRFFVLEIEHQAIDLEVYRISLGKAKAPTNAKTNPSLTMPEEKAKTAYKEAAEKFPL